jgi:hypothetical protein
LQTGTNAVTHRNIKVSKSVHAHFLFHSFIEGRLHLNRQVVTLLSGLGIQDEIFQNLQEEMLFELSDTLLHDDKALLSLKEVSIIIFNTQQFLESNFRNIDKETTA